MSCFGLLNSRVLVNFGVRFQFNQGRFTPSVHDWLILRVSEPSSPTYPYLTLSYVLLITSFLLLLLRVTIQDLLRPSLDLGFVYINTVE